MRIIRQHCDGEYVISEFIMQAEHVEVWIGIKPTGKALTLTGVDIDRMVDGKIVEHGGAVNTVETLWENRLIQPV
jgi:predicted ester cyclase